jgi:hypothetical protein
LHASVEHIPSAVRRFLESLPPSQAALIGCRSTDASLDCCEYDIAIFAENSKKPQVVRVENQMVELLYISDKPTSRITDLYGLKVIRDSNKFALASGAKEITQEKFVKALRALGRKEIVSSRICQRMAEQSSEPVTSQMWYKIAAHRFVSGAIALSGKRPMPLHELEQTRHIEASTALAEGLSAAIECIGLERATRPSISRSIEALRELKSRDYDRDLVMSKIEFLLSRQMLPDCYLYIGRMASENLARRKSAFHKSYAKLVQLALDLTSDNQQIEKMHRSLFKAASTILKE